MSQYEFVCKDCKKRFTVVQPITTYSPKKVTCPKCKSTNVSRIWDSVNVVTSKKS